MVSIDLTMMMVTEMIKVGTDDELDRLRILANKARQEFEDNVEKDKHNLEHPDDPRFTSVKALLEYENFLFQLVEEIIYV